MAYESKKNRPIIFCNDCLNIGVIPVFESFLTNPAEA
jgi:hypothetical protein